MYCLIVSTRSTLTEKKSLHIFTYINTTIESPAKLFTFKMYCRNKARQQIKTIHLYFYFLFITMTIFYRQIVKTKPSCLKKVTNNLLMMLIFRKQLLSSGFDIVDKMSSWEAQWMMTNNKSADGCARVLFWLLGRQKILYIETVSI